MAGFPQTDLVHTPHPDADTLTRRLQRALGDAYRLERELGGGGMSRVFVAHDVALDRRVVVKVLPETVAEGLSVERFRREIMVSAGLQHPNIVPVIAAGDAEGLPWFVMPFVEGESLRHRLARGSLLVPEVVAILRDVGRALAHAHARGVIHRDIKPDNILLTGGAAVVADFGVAKALVDAAPGAAPSSGTLTRVGVSLGTPAYMAPEQVVADPAADHRVDLYALGVTAWEMLTGRPPFVGATVSEVMSAHLTRTAEPLATARPGAPVALARLVAACMEKSPADRPASADELLRRLEDPAVVSGALPSLPSVAAIPAPRRPARTWWMVAAGIAAAAAMVWVVRGPGAATPAAPPTIAVLPLELASADTADAYLAQGIADEVLNALSRLQGVKVASRLAARSIATAPTPGDEARTLGVTLALSGTVQRRGDRVRVTAELARLADGVAIWSETYDRPDDALFALQGDIAGSVAAVVRADVVRDGTARSTPAETRDPVAYDEYLRGHYLLARRGAATIREAIGRFEASIARDSSFARAHAELAQAHAVLPLYTGGGTESFVTAERAARTALALDTSLAPAHAALGYLHNAAWHWADGRAALERAVALDSSDASAWQWLGENQLIAGDPTRAREAFSTAARMEDVPISRALEAVAAALAGDTDAGIAAGRRIVDANPSQAVPRYMLGTILAYAGRYDEAISELREARRLAPGVLAVSGTLGHALARRGDTPGARAILAELQRTPGAPGVQPALAKVMVALGDGEGAMRALERAAAAHDGFFASEPFRSPLFASLTTHPRYPALLTTLGLPDARQAAPTAGTPRLPPG